MTTGDRSVATFEPAEPSDTDATERVSATQSITRIEIERIGWSQRGARYRVQHDGKVLIDSCRDPERESCRTLLAIGVTGTLETYFPGGTVARMRLDIEAGAKHSARDTDAVGLHRVKWVAFGMRGDDADGE